MVARVHEHLDDGGDERARTPHRHRLEPSLAVVDAGLARLEDRSARGDGRRLLRLHEPALPHDEPGPGARAARPAAPVPERDGRRRLRALRRRRRLADRQEPPPAGAGARARARAAGVRPARAARHRLGLRRRLGAGVPDRGRPGDTAVRAAAPVTGRGADGERRRARGRLLAVRGLVRRPLDRAGGGGDRDRQRTGGRSRAQGPFGQPAPRRAPARGGRRRDQQRVQVEDAPAEAGRVRRRARLPRSRRRDCSPTTPRPGTRSGTSTSSTGTARGLRCLPSAASRC